MINAVIYARTSPDCPASAEGQIERLKAVAAERGWAVSKIFVDRPTPAKKTGRERRPGENELRAAIQRGGVQKLLLLSIDRVGRSLVELVGLLEMCRVRGVVLYLLDHGIDTMTSNGTSLFDMAELMAFHLRQSRRDRILRGQAVAREALVKFGRPPISTTKMEKAKQGLASGKGVREVARLAGISATSVSRLKASMNVEARSRVARYLLDASSGAAAV
jgi:DNA invertase Pin-like site-specific DNA recombinase